jgi:hypothetical protein
VAVKVGIIVKVHPFQGGFGTAQGTVTVRNASGLEQQVLNPETFRFRTWCRSIKRVHEGMQAQRQQVNK